MQSIRAAIIVLILVVIGALLWVFRDSAFLSHFLGSNTGSQSPITTVSYICNDGKTITASYSQGGAAAEPAPGQPPTPTGSVGVVLSDGRTLQLQQTISADGTRYANQDESIVFWSRGNGAFVQENNTQTYGGCVAAAPDPGDLPQIYADGTLGFSIRYPAGYLLNTTYQYQELGPGKEINGVKFAVPASAVRGTNLAEDSGVSVEEIPQATSCVPSMFLDGVKNTATVDDHGTTYEVASTTGAGAGNRYEETVYTLPGTNLCFAVRYFIHYGVIDNYPPGAVQAFDEKALLGKFDEIRHTLTLAP